MSAKEVDAVSAESGNLSLPTDRYVLSHKLIVVAAKTKNRWVKKYNTCT